MASETTLLAREVGSLVARGLELDQVHVLARDWNLKRCEQPLGQQEVAAVVESIWKADARNHSDNHEDDLMSAVQWPAPPEVIAFHGLAGEFVKTVGLETEADRVALLVHFLAEFGSAVGRAPHFKVGATCHHANLFTCIVGRTASARKGTALDATHQVFEIAASTWSTTRVIKGLSTGEGLIHAVRDRIEVERDGATVVEDEGVSDKRLLAVETEFARVLKASKRETNTLSMVMREAWDGKQLAIRTRKHPITATGPHVSIIAHITKAELRRALTETDMLNGFGNRFLWLCVERSQFLPSGGNMPQAKIENLGRETCQALEQARKRTLIQRDEDAERFWDDEGLYMRLEKEADVPGLIGAMIGRASPQVMRLAMIYALLDRADAIGRVHLEAARELWRYCRDSARFIFGDAVVDPRENKALEALRAAPGGLTRTEISALFSRNLKREQLDAILRALLDQGKARFDRDATGGRSAERWFARGVAG